MMSIKRGCGKALYNAIARGELKSGLAMPYAEAGAVLTAVEKVMTS